MPNTAWLHLPHRRSNSSHNVHPIYQRPASATRMDLCTENLGCEAGTPIDDFQTASDMEVRQEDTRRPETTFRSYRPPLATINSIAVKARREDGRLVIREHCHLAHVKFMPRGVMAVSFYALCLRH